MPHKTPLRRTLSLVVLLGSVFSLALILYFNEHSLGLFASQFRQNGSVVTGQVQDYSMPTIANAAALNEQIKVRFWSPVRLKIPGINVDAVIEPVGLTPQGAMDVPRDPAGAAWFELGPRPGENGSAVVAGHYGWKNGIPAVFDNLHKLQKGDRLYVEDEGGVVTTFVVRELRRYSDNADAPDVFSSSDGASHLNLVTCEGVWDKTEKSYSNRLVVFTDAIPSEGGASTATAPAKNAVASIETMFSRSFGMGAEGADVAALQTALEERGLLRIPPGVAKGFFGALTSAAVTKYQASVGLPQVGVFGPLTRARLTSELDGE